MTFLRNGQVLINVAGRQPALVAAATASLRTLVAHNDTPSSDVPPVPPPPPPPFKPPLLFGPAPYRLSISDRLERAEALAEEGRRGSPRLAVPDFERQVLGASLETKYRSLLVRYSAWRKRLSDEERVRLDGAMEVATGKEGGVRTLPPSPEKVAWREAVREAKREGVEERRDIARNARWRRDLVCVRRGVDLAEIFAAHPEKQKPSVELFQRYVLEQYEVPLARVANLFKELRQRLPQNVREALDQAMETVTGKKGGTHGFGVRARETLRAALALRPRKAKEPRPTAPKEPPLLSPEAEHQRFIDGATFNLLRCFRRIAAHIARREGARWLGQQRGKRYREIDEGRVARAQQLAAEWEAEKVSDPLKGFMRPSTFHFLVLQGGDCKLVNKPRLLSHTFGAFLRRLSASQQVVMDQAFFTCTGRHLGQTGHIKGQKIGPYRRVATG